MINIRFYIRGTKPVKKIYFRYCPDRNLDISIKTPYSVSSDDWDNENECFNLNKIVKGAKSVEAKQKNIQIEQNNNILNTFRSEITNLIGDNLHLNKEDLKKTLRNFVLKNYFGHKVRTKTLIPNKISDLIDYYIQFRSVRDTTQDKEPLAENTIKKLKGMQKVLNAFNDDLVISDINNIFRRDFTAWLDKKKYSPQSQGKLLKDLKTICLFAKTEHAISPDIENWYIKSSTDTENKAKGIYFTFDQLKALRFLDLSKNEKLDNARDWLLISVYTAVRVSELMKMKREDISQNDKGHDIIKVIEDKNRNKKGGGLKYLPLFDEVKTILSKRNGDFPRAISSQKYNEYIKQVCKEAGFNEMVESAVKQNTADGHRKVSGKYPFWQLVTSHIGRQTFVSLFSDKLGVEVVQMMTNHQSQKMTLHYNKTDYDTQQFRKAETIANAFDEMKNILKIV